MPGPVPQASIEVRASKLGLVGLCFFLSGFAALVYQMAWLRSLSLVFGTSHLAVATVLAAYMGGLAAGAWLASRYAGRIRRPVLAYGFLELVIAVSSVLVPVFLALAQVLLHELIGHSSEPPDAAGMTQTLFYLVAAFIILGIPTTAMGATLPLLAKDVIHSDGDVGPRVGQLYGLNTLGAVGGALAGGFLLLPYLGLKLALVTGAAINLVVFGIVFVMLRRPAGSDSDMVPATAATTPGTSDGTFHPVMPLMLVSGMVSFGLEVLWTRLLSHVFGGTIYAFSIMLSAFLVGIAFGSLIAGRLATDRERAGIGFVIAQVGIGCASIGAFALLGLYAPASEDLLINSIYAFCIIVPSALFIGATFPLAVRIASPGLEETANTVGRIYAFNTVGAIIGSLLAGFLLLPMLGLAGFLQLLVALSAAIAVASLLIVALRPPIVPTLGALAVLACIGLFLPTRPDRIIYGHVEDTAEAGRERFFAVGTSSTVLLREHNGFAFMSTDGLAESVIPRRGMPPIKSSQSWLGGLPLLARPDARDVLIVGFGGGQVIEGLPPSVEKIDVIELEPQVIAANRAFAAERLFDPLADRRVSIIRNDARNAMALTDRRYDVIVSQPSHPWTGGASHLYTREFLALAKGKLAKGGALLQWINLEFTDEELLRSFAATILAEFAYAELYQPEPRVLLFVASDQPIGLIGGQAGVERSLAQAGAHYRAIGLRTKEDLAVISVLDEEGLAAFAAGHAPNTDDLNRLAFHARWKGDGLTLEAARRLFGPEDPLLDPRSDLRAWLGEENLAYVAEQLLQTGQVDRACRLPSTILRKAVRLTVAGLCLEQIERPAEARRILFEAISADSDYAPAQIAVLLMHLPDFAMGRLPPEIASLANRQRGPHRRIFEGWILGAMGDFDRLRMLDGELSQVAPTSLGYPAAVKLRVDWRVATAARTGDASHAAEGLTILDSLLATFTSPELYLLRATAAHFAGDRDALFETTGLLVRYVREQQRNPSGAREQEILFIKDRLESLRDWVRSAPGAAGNKRAEELLAAIDSLR